MVSSALKKISGRVFVFFLIFLIGSMLSYYRGKLEMAAVAERQMAKIQELKDELHKKEMNYASEIGAIIQEQRDSAERYSNIIANIISSNAGELQQSAKRASNYRALSETRALEIAELAGRYDKLITEAIGLAEQCQAGIEQRQRAINLLEQRIQSDIRLINDD